MDEPVPLFLVRLADDGVGRPMRLQRAFARQGLGLVAQLVRARA